MTDLHFDAIIAKNNIAREIRDSRQHHEEINASWVEAQLAIIEQFIGEGNQPAISDILESEYGL